MGYIDRATAAKRLLVNEKTLDRMIKRGAFPAYRIGPRMVRIDEKELEAYIRARRVEPEAGRWAEPLERPCLYVPGMKVV